MGGVMGRGTIWGALAVLGLALAPGIARAAEFAVDSPTDAVDADVGDGKCVSVSENGGCTLRAAVQEADAAGAASTIVIPAGRYKLTIAAVPEAGSAADRDAGNGDLVINADVTLRGAGALVVIVVGGGV